MTCLCLKEISTGDRWARIEKCRMHKAFSTSTSCLSSKLNVELVKSLKPPESYLFYELIICNIAIPRITPISSLNKVDINVGRIAVRLGWVPLEPLPEEVQMHLLDT